MPNDDFDATRPMVGLSQDESSQCLDSRDRSDEISALCSANHSMALKYARTVWARNASLRDRLDASDAESAGGFALYRAAVSWNPKSGEFGPWLRRHVRYEILEAARQAAIVPRSAMAKLKEMREVENVLEEATGKTPTHAEIQAEMGITSREYSELLQLRNSAREASELPIADALHSQTENDSDAIESAVAEAMEAFGPLSGDERVIMSLHYFEKVPFRDVARILGKRPDAVSRLHGRAKERLRDFIAEQGATESSA